MRTIAVVGEPLRGLGGDRHAGRPAGQLVAVLRATRRLRMEAQGTPGDGWRGSLVTDGFRGRLV